MTYRLALDECKNICTLFGDECTSFAHLPETYNGRADYYLKNFTADQIDSCTPELSETEIDGNTYPYTLYKNI